MLTSNLKSRSWGGGMVSPFNLAPARPARLVQRRQESSREVGFSTRLSSGTPSISPENRGLGGKCTQAHTVLQGTPPQSFVISPATPEKAKRSPTAGTEAGGGRGTPGGKQGLWGKRMYRPPRRGGPGARRGRGAGRRRAGATAAAGRAWRRPGRGCRPAGPASWSAAAPRCSPAASGRGAGARRGSR